jgi:hypothetical protein
MTFTFSQPRRLSIEESSPTGNLYANALKKYQQGVNAHYAPQRQEADIFAKEMGPMAALASNPNFSFDPQVREMISKRIADHIEKTQQKGGHEGLLNAILHKNWLGKQEEAANLPQAGNQAQLGMTGGMQQGANNNFSLLPQAGQGLQAGAQAKAQAPFMSSPYAPGALYQNPNTGDVLSAPTHEQVAAAQKTITSNKAVEPIIKDLIKQSKPFLKQGGKLGLATGQAAGIASQFGAPDFLTNLVGDKEKANKYAEFQATQSLAIERLMGALNLPLNQESQHTVATIVQPHPGENDKGYETRMIRELVTLQRNAQQAQNTLGSGFNLSGVQNQSQEQPQVNEEPLDQNAMGQAGHSIMMRAPDGTINPVPIHLLEKARSMGLTPVD